MEQSRKNQQDDLDRHLDDDFEKYHRPSRSRRYIQPEMETRHKLSSYARNAKAGRIELDPS